jgi:serine/threonine protein kinase/Tfp pilus assembly protein PilF
MYNEKNIFVIQNGGQAAFYLSPNGQERSDMIGQTVSHYRIIEKLGQGGMGVVYLAEDLKLKRKVALKFLPAQSHADEEEKKRFIHEAQAASALDHPNICTIHEIDESADGLLFMVMAHYDGDTLKGMISRGSLEIKKVLHIASQILDGLQEAQASGIVHRDIKPANIFITSRGQAKILDFGLAKLKGRTRLTKSGTMLGTLAYSSPEQLSGEEVDHRTDIWSLGVVIYEMITARLPFGGEYEQAMMYSILNEEPVAIGRELPGGLDGIIARALAKDPAKRYASYAEFREAMESARERIKDHGDRRPKADEKALPSIAVLPFVNMSPDPEDQYFGDGLAEELINALAQIQGLRVPARTSSFRFRGEDVDIREIGHRLNVRHVLEGSVRRAGRRLRVTAQLIKVADGYHLWSERFDRELQDVFAVQDEIAQAIVRQLQVKLVGPQGQNLVIQRTENLEAYSAFLKGRYYLNTLTAEGWKKSYTLFQKAIELDPEFPLPYEILAHYYQSMAWWGSAAPRQIMPQSQAASEKALALDNSLGMAHASLAICYWAYHREIEKAERELQLGIEAEPASAWNHVFYALFLGCRGRHAEAITEARNGLRLDPLSSLGAAWAASTLCGAGAADEALEICREAISMDPDHWHLYYHHGLACLHASKLEAAVDSFKRAVSLSTNAAVTVSLLAITHYALGNRDEADRLTDGLVRRSREEYVAPFFLACLHAARHDQGRALEYLQEAVEERDLFLASYPMHPPQFQLKGAEFDSLLAPTGLIYWLAAD